MGNRVKELFTSVYSDNKEETPIPEEIDEAFFKFSFTINAETTFLEQRKMSLEYIVTERNKLIHQTLSSFDPTSIESCRTLNVVLDKQAERVRSEFESILTLVKALNEVTKKALEVFANEISTT